MAGPRATSPAAEGAEARAPPAEARAAPRPCARPPWPGARCGHRSAQRTLPSQRAPVRPRPQHGAPWPPPLPPAQRGGGRAHARTHAKGGLASRRPSGRAQAFGARPGRALACKVWQRGAAREARAACRSTTPATATAATTSVPVSRIVMITHIPACCCSGQSEAPARRTHRARVQPPTNRHPLISLLAAETRDLPAGAAPRRFCMAKGELGQDDLWAPSPRASAAAAWPCFRRGA